MEVAGTELVRDIVTRGDAGRVRFADEVKRVALEFRLRRQPSHTLSADVAVDERHLVPVFLMLRERRDEVTRLHAFVTPLVGVHIDEARGVHLTGRTDPVETEGELSPANLRTDLFLTHVVRPAAAIHADRAAEHEEVDRRAVRHVGVEPLVHAGADDDHRLAAGLLSGLREFARHMHDAFGRNTRDDFLPLRGAGEIVRVAAGAVRIVVAVLNAVVREEQVKGRRDEDRLAVPEVDAADRDLVRDQGVVRRGSEIRVLVFSAAEVREEDFHDVVVVILLRELRRELAAGAAVFVLQVPLTLARVTGGHRAVRDHELVFGIAENRSEVRAFLVVKPKVIGEVAGAKQTARGVLTVRLLLELHEERKVRVLADVLVKVRGRPIHEEFLQDHVTHRHAERGVRALLRSEPHVSKLRRVGVVRRNDDNRGALIAHLGHEGRVRSTRHRDVRAPEHQERAVKPVLAFGYVSLLAPGLGRGRRKVAVEIVEGERRAAEQRQVADTGSVGDLRERGNRGETGVAVRTVLLRGPDVRGSHDLVGRIPVHADKAAQTADLLIGLCLFLIRDDRTPGLHRVLFLLLRLFPELEQLAADHRVLHAARVVEVPGIRSATRAAARLMIRHIGTVIRVVGRLDFPGHDSLLNEDLPGTRTGTVHAMRGTDHFIVLPAIAIKLFPGTRGVILGAEVAKVGKGISHFLFS